MTLHCAGRLGVLSYLYQNKNQIAHSLGLITELPIALCSSDYDFDTGYVFQSTDDSSATLPLLFQVSELNLFITTKFQLPSADRLLLTVFQFYSEQEKLLMRPPQSVFQPPAVS